MRFIKKYNEEVKFEHEWDPECEKLQKEINKYNNILLNDEVWKNFYHHIDDYYKKQLDSDFLESIIEFGKKRLEDIKKEKEELLLDVKDIIQDIEDETDFIDSVEYYQHKYDKDGEVLLNFNCTVKIHLTKNITETRKYYNEPQQYFHSSYEIINLFPHLITATSRLEALGLKVFLSTMPNNSLMIFKLSI